MQGVDRILDVAGMQASGDDELADAVDDASPGLHAFPVEGFGRCRRVVPAVEESSRTPEMTPGRKPWVSQEKVSILGDVDLVHTLALVGLVGLNQSYGDRIPAYGFCPAGLSKI